MFLFVFLPLEEAISTSSPTPLDIWTPSGKYIQPQLLDQFALGYFKSIKEGDIVGYLSVYVSGEFKKKVSILSTENIKKSNIFSRLFKSLNYLVWGDA